MSRAKQTIWDRWANRIADGVVGWPKTVIAACLIITVVLAAGNAFYRNTLNYQFFFSEDNPQLQAFESLQADYNRTEAVFIAVEPQDGDVFSPSSLQLLEAMTEAAWQIPYSLRVDSLVNFQHTEGSEDGLTLYGLFEGAEKLSDEERLRRKKVALSEPSLVNALVSPSGDVAGIRVTINLPGVALEKETPEVVLYVRRMVAEFEESHPGLRTYLTGQIVVDQAFPESTEGDMGFVWPAFFVVMVLLLVAIFRNFSFMLVTMLVGVLAIAAGMGALGWTHMRVNAAVTAAPIMILTLAIADCIHLLSSYRQQRDAGMSAEQAWRVSLRLNLFPVFLTSFMTLAGFLTLHFNDSPPYQALGYVVASGVAFAFLYAVPFLPAWMLVMPHKTLSTAQNAASSARMGQLGLWIARHPKKVIALALLPAVFLSVSVLKNRINDNPVHYFGESQEMRQHLEFVNQRITGLGTLNYSLNSMEKGGVADPEYLTRLEAFTQWLKAQPGVVQVDSLADVIKRINRSLHSEDPAYYRIPEERALAAQYLLLYQLSLPVGVDISNLLTLDQSASRVRVAMNNTEGSYHIELDQAAQNWLRANTPEAMWSEGASAPLMFAHIGQRSTEGILWGLLGSLVLMSFILIRVLRSAVLGVLSLVSNLVPVAMGFGVWAWVNGDIDLGITVTFAIAFGIVVDDTIHFLSKYQRLRVEDGLPAEEALSKAFSSVGMALLVTSIVLIAGFAMLGFSAMNITSHMALLTTVTIFMAFLVDFFLVPPLLILLDHWVVTGNRSSKNEVV